MQGFILCLQVGGYRGGKWWLVQSWLAWQYGPGPAWHASQEAEANSAAVGIRQTWAGFQTYSFIAQ